MLRLFAALILAGCAAGAQAQPGDRAPGRLRAFLDCQIGACDRDFFQTELPLVQFVRDPADAAVSVLVLEDATGGGGERYTLYFQGRGAQAGRRDTLRAEVPPAATDDDERRAVLSRLALGFAPYAARSGLADQIVVTYAAPAETAALAPVRDPWGGWVFELNGRGFFNGEQQQRQYNVYGSTSASRTTEVWKTLVGAEGSFRESRFSFPTDTGGDTTVVSTVTNYGGFGSVVRSLSSRWSVGGAASAFRQSFRNYDLRVRAGPAIEYNVFPYAEATERQFRLLYAAGVEAAAYTDTTIYAQTSEVLPVHQLTVAVEFNRPWGEVEVNFDASQYLDAPAEFYRVGVFGEVSVRLARGLQFEVDGGADLVRDQRYLPAGGATADEILTRQQALATGYEYFVSVGLSYTFGSVLNPVVNPRFGRGLPF